MRASFRLENGWKWKWIERLSGSEDSKDVATTSACVSVGASYFSGLGLGDERYDAK